MVEAIEMNGPGKCSSGSHCVGRNLKKEKFEIVCHLTAVILSS
jgi:hypothetical protein